MRNFILGVIITLLVLVAGGLCLALLGFVHTNADATPPSWEQRIAMSSLDAAMERHAPRVNNPVPPTDDNIIDGMKLYTMNCAGCHGGPENKPGRSAHFQYPPPPPLIPAPLRNPQWHIFYPIPTGGRSSGTPPLTKKLRPRGRAEV